MKSLPPSHCPSRMYPLHFILELLPTQNQIPTAKQIKRQEYSCYNGHSP